MAEQTWVLTDPEGNVVNTVVATQEFVDGLIAAVDDPNTDTGYLPVGVRAHRRDTALDDRNEPPGLHHRLVNGKWELDPAEAEQRVRDGLLGLERAAESERVAVTMRERAARLAQLQTKVGPGKPGLTPAERDELNILLAIRL